VLQSNLLQVVGSTCTTFRLVEGGTLILYLRPTESLSGPASEATLWLDCAWRLRTKQEILVGSLNEADLVLKQLQQLSGQTVAHVTCDEHSKDLRISFSPSLIIETFSHSTQDEVWELRKADGYRLGVGAGLQLYERQLPVQAE
jgi:hypothetical protein